MFWFTFLPFVVRMCCMVCQVIPLSCSYIRGVMIIVPAWLAILGRLWPLVYAKCSFSGCNTAKMVRHRGWPTGFLRVCLLPIRGIMVSSLVFCFDSVPTEASYISRSLCRSRTNSRVDARHCRSLHGGRHQCRCIMTAEGSVMLVM